MKIIVVLLTLALIVVTNNQVQMKMDITEKLSNNQPLTAQEAQKLRSMLQSLDTIVGWVGADGQPMLRSVYIRVPEFEVIPLGSLNVARNQSVQVIPDSANTEISLDNVTSRTNSNKYITAVQFSEKITCIVAHRFMFHGTVTFEANATGDRSVLVTVYNADGSVARATGAIATIKSATLETVVTFEYSYPMSKGQYIVFSVFQNSGGDLDANMGLVAFAID